MRSNANYPRQAALPLLTVLMLVTAHAGCAPPPFDTPVAEAVTPTADDAATVATPNPKGSPPPSLGPTIVLETALNVPVRPTTVPVPGVMTDDFLFDSVDANCQLPCWHGLRSGISTLDDIRRVLGPVSITQYAGNPDAPGFFAFPGYVNAVDQWFRTEPDDGDRALRITIDAESQKLEALVFTWVDEESENRIYPQRVIEELGTPDDMRVYIRDTEMTTTYVIDVAIVYNSGIVYGGTNTIPAEIDRVEVNGLNQVAAAELQFCLGIESWSQYHSSRTGRMTLMNTLSARLDDLLPHENWIMQLPVRLDLLTSIEEEFDISLEEIANRVEAEDNACLYKDITDAFN